MSKTIRIFIVDDHFVVREGLADLLLDEGIEVVGSAADSVSAIAKISTTDLDLVLVDLNLDDENGLDLIITLKEMNPAIHILVYSMRESIQMMAAAYRNGALGYVTKSADPDILVEAIRAVSKGEPYVMTKYAADVVRYSSQQAQAKDPKIRLSEKELTLFLMLSDGQTQEYCENALELSGKSILNRVTEIKRKLECEREDFTRIALRHGLISPE